MAACQNVVLYTCVVAKRDPFKGFPFRDDFRYVLFSDEGKVPKGWDLIKVDHHDPDPVRVARYYKHNPFIFFSDCKFAIWLDATHWQVQSLNPLLSDDFDIALMEHFSRKNVRDEAKACCDLGVDKKELIMAQLESYFNDGFTDDQGLYSTTCLIRRNIDTCISFCDTWWQEIQKWSKRDQISFPYCKWKASNIKVKKMPGFCRHENKPRSNSQFFRMRSHHIQTKIY